MQSKRKLLLAVLSFTMLFAARSIALETQPAQDQKEKKVLQNSDIVQMAQNHFDDETLLTVIDANDTKFDVSPSALIDLKNAGVSDRVIRAMLQTTMKKSNAATSAPASSAAQSSTASPATDTASSVASAPASSAAVSPATMAQGQPVAMTGGMRGTGAGMSPAMQAQLSSMAMGNMGGMFSVMTPEQMPHVYLMSQPSKEEIPASTAQIAQSKMKMGGPSQGGMLLHSAASTALSFAAIGAGPGGMMAMSAFSMGSSLMGHGRPKGPTMTYVWGLPGLHSSRGLNTPTPMFQLNFGDIPGVDPDEYEPALVRLVQTKDNYRLVGATQSQMGMMGGGGGSKWVSEDRLPVRLDKEERGVYVVHVDQALEPGEYAVVLHPFKGQTLKPSGFSGMGGMGGFGAGPQLFYSVWDFTVAGAPPAASSDKKKKK